MGFRQAAVLASVSFFLGVLFICFIVDHRILYGELTDEVIEDGFEFYTTFFNAPPAIKGLLHGIIGAGVLALVFKLTPLDESALFFDGSSLAAYIFGIAIYAAVTIPALRTIVTPLQAVDAVDGVGAVEGETREERVEALRVLAAGNTIVGVLMCGIVFMQAGQEYARRLEAKELARVEAEEKRKKEKAGKEE